MGDAQPQRISNKFIKLLEERYEREFGRNFSFPKVTDRLVEDLRSLEADIKKRRKLL